MHFGSAGTPPWGTESGSWRFLAVSPMGSISARAEGLKHKSDSIQIYLRANKALKSVWEHTRTNIGHQRLLPKRRVNHRTQNTLITANFITSFGASLVHQPKVVLEGIMIRGAKMQCWIIRILLRPAPAT